MKIRLIATGFVLGAASALLAGKAVSQDTGGMPSPAEMQKMMEDYAESMKPGTHHRRLDHCIGSWDTTTKMWWMGPGSPPVETGGTATFEWVLDGRFVLQKIDSVMLMPDMNTGGMQEIPWKGMGLFGYDSNRNMYVGCWADSLSTWLLNMKGTASRDGTVFTYYGEMDEPMLNVFGRYVKYVTRVVDEDTFIFEIVDLHAGDDYKVIEMTYTRRK